MLSLPLDFLFVLFLLCASFLQSINFRLRLVRGLFL